MVPMRRAVEVLVGLEGLMLLAGAGYLIAGLAGRSAQEPMAAIVMVAMALAMAAFLGLCTWAVHRGRAWARGPLLVWQVLQVAVIWPSFRTVTSFAVAIICGSIAVAVGLFAPGVLDSRPGEN